MLTFSLSCCEPAGVAFLRDGERLGFAPAAAAPAPFALRAASAAACSRSTRRRTVACAHIEQAELPQ